jgi:7,8-dihydropterin-6-yl-methyl-4-(beta-D-ribofuranosyl)aminobenzene 5'-phosphate synthase
LHPQLLVMSRETKMRLTVLVDNNTLIDRYFYGEPGVSYFIKDEGQRILFDVGYSDVFIKNAQKMNINLRDIDFLVISHGHLDHTWGLDPLIRLYTEAMIEEINYRKPTLIAHPLTFLTKMLNGLEEVGSIISEEKLSRHFQIKLSKEPVWLTEKLVFLGEIERRNDFEAKSPIGQVVKDNLEEDDYLMDDSALAYKSPRGLVIITGCSHAGICNIVEYAKEICEDDRIVDIVGGFHLLDPPEEQLQGTLKYMKELQPTEVHACHCTDLNSKIVLSRVVNLKEVGAGLTLEYQ